MSSISLDSLDSALHSVEIKDASGQAIAIDASGFITANINGAVTVSATNLDIRDLTSATDNVEIKTAAGQALAIDASGFLTSNINGVVSIDDNGGSITVDGTVAATQSGAWSVTTNPGGWASWKVTAVSASTVESELVATPLLGRLSILIQNLGSQDVYLKEATGVSTVNGMKVPKGSSFTANLDDVANLFAITGASTSDLRIVEYAA